MKINKISIENFRGFEELELNFNGKSAVIVGANGAGKSTIINAAVTSISIMMDKLSYNVSKRVELKETDIKNGKQRYIINTKVVHESNEGIINIVKPRSKAVQSKSLSNTKNSNFKSIISSIHNKFEDNVPINLPVTVFYSAYRNVIDVPSRIKNRHEFDQFSSYFNCFSSSTDFRTFFEWFRNQEDLENEEKLDSNRDYKDPQLEAVRNAIYGMMPGFTDLRIMRKGKMRMVISKYEQRLEIDQLSDGEKCTLAMIGDLARRLALANPHLNNSLEGEGVVFIDEIELHLHPSWQREIIKRLEYIFPNIQFIISTHSPQVLGEISNANIYIINDIDNMNKFSVKEIDNTFGKDSNLILEEYMNATSKNIEIQMQLDSLYQKISLNKIEEAEKIFESLSEILGVEYPSLIKAKLIIKRKKILGK